MANPIKNEEEIYEQLKKENVQVHPLVWKLKSHHIRNDLMVLASDVALYNFIPEKILQEASEFITRRYKEENCPGDPSVDLKGSFSKVLVRTKNIDEFLKKLRELTLEEDR